MTTSKPEGKTRGRTPVGRVSYPHIFKAQKDTKTGKETFSVVLMFPKSQDLSELRKAYEAAIEKKWGKKPKGCKSPFRDGDEVDEDGDRKHGPEYKDQNFISFRTSADRVVGVVDAKLNKVTAQSGKLYPGCYAIVSYNAYGYENESIGVSFALNNLQIVRDGDRLDSHTEAEDDFDAIESDETEEPMF